VCQYEELIKRGRDLIAATNYLISVTKRLLAESEVVISGRPRSFPPSPTKPPQAEIQFCGMHLETLRNSGYVAIPHPERWQRSSAAPPLTFDRSQHSAQPCSELRDSCQTAKKERKLAMWGL
jgi:hypothetical protein